MKKLLALAFLPLSLNALADTAYTLPGAAGQPAMQHDTTHTYQCASDGHAMFANTAAGYGRCQAVFPLVVAASGPVGVLTAQVAHFSKDKSSSVSLSVYKRGLNGIELISSVSDFSPSAAQLETSTAVFGEVIFPGQSIYAVIEVRGDTQIQDVAFETVD